jgi:hypothetical protein
MRKPRQLILLSAAGLAWCAAVALGLAKLRAYEAAPGTALQESQIWPQNTAISRDDAQPTLVVFLHPQCPCSRATVGELERLVAQCQGKLAVRAMVIRPAGEADGWERTGLWDSAAAIPGVTVETDLDGAESRRFGAATSGQTFLYDAHGVLRFAGGITQSRGHAGDNVGRAAIAAIVCDAQDLGSPTTPVYGCPLFDITSACPAEGSATCHIK